MLHMPFRCRREEGQILIVAVLFLGVVFGFTAMAIDVGMLLEDRRDMQNAADSATLAGIQYLPQQPQVAIDTAEQWALNNGVSQDQIEAVTVQSTHVANDTLYVRLNKDFSWVFGRVLGMTTSDVGASAKALVGTVEGTNDLMPWSIVQGDSSCLDANGNAIFGQTCSVKLGAQSKFGGGWRGALDFDGNGGGANEYRDNIIDGEADTAYCIAGQAAPPCESSVVDIQTGNVVGPSQQGIEARLAGGPACDSDGNGKDDFDEVFVSTGLASPAYTVACPDSPRLIMIPIVEYDGGQTVTIRGWSLAYFDTYYCGAGALLPGSDGSYVYSVDDVKVLSGVAPHCRAGVDPFLAENVASIGGEGANALYVRQPLAGALPVPPACHQGTPHGQQTCGTPTPTPGPTSTPAPSTTPSPTPISNENCNGNGHWEVQIQIVDASYSQGAGFLGAYDADGGVTARKLIE